MEPNPSSPKLPYSHTPTRHDYHMPAEWHPHTATWLSWPHNAETWPGEYLPEVERTYAQIIRHLLPGEKVNLLVNDEAMERHARRLLQVQGIDCDAVQFHRIPTVDAWMRDYGPTFLIPSPFTPSPLHPFTPSGVAMVHWRFNGWGDKYPEYSRDSSVPVRINESFNGNATKAVPYFEPGIVMEGGSIEVNGCGSLLTTEQCLLNPNRNPHLSKSEIEQYLRDSLGVRHIIWLKEGIAGDDTDGHVDDIARFASPDTVICAVQQESDDDNFKPLKENYRRLQGATDQDGGPLHVIPLPMPKAIYADGRRLPASYANFYIGNNVVLAPIFQDANDERALQTLQRWFLDRKVIGIDCRALVYGYGAIHCITQQQPVPMRLIGNLNEQNP